MKGTTRFVLRIDKERKTGKCPVELIYSLKGQRKYINTGTNLFPINWDADEQKAIYVDKKAAKQAAPTISYVDLLADVEAEDINSRFFVLVNGLSNIEARFELDRVEYSSEMIVDAFKEQTKPLAKKEAPSDFLFDFIDKYIEENKYTRVTGSLNVYKQLKRHLGDFQKVTGQKVAFKNIDYGFFQSFQAYLLKVRIKVGEEERRLQNTTVAKQLSVLKTFLGYARKHGVVVPDGWRDFTIKRNDLPVIALTENEFLALYNKDLANNKKLAHVRDVFCFSCVTGLRYSDLAALRWDNVKGDEIRITVTKTKQPLTIPLSGYAVDILRRYEGIARPLPIISSQKFNDYVKELAKLVEINEPTEITRYYGAVKTVEVFPKHELVTAHVGRKTFCTLSLEKGMSAEQVMRISGHKDYRSFQRYVNVTEHLKRQSIHKAWGAPERPLHLKVVGGDE